MEGCQLAANRFWFCEECKLGAVKARFMRFAARGALRLFLWAKSYIIHNGIPGEQDDNIKSKAR
jgi:hypothetical protein